jgi:homocysteine S-methyltransferase
MQGPAFVRQAHDAFAHSGAQVLTTNSYAVVPFHIGQERFEAQGVALARLSAELARASADAAGHKVLVAGSLPPALGSYRPDLFVHAQSVAIHRKLIEGMDALVDVWLAETQSSIAEIRAAHEALGINTKPLWISFTLDDEPEGDAVTLRSGEPVDAAVREALALGAKAVLFNCSQPEVMEAAVVARPDEKWGETPCAFVTLKPGATATAEEIIAFCRASMAHFTGPKAVVFGPLPKTSTGKIQKFVLRDQAKAL